MSRLHQNNFSTNVTSNQIAGVTTTPLNSIPSIAAPFYIALDATNVNGKYETVDVTSKTATNINHSATIYAHTTAEEVRMVVPAVELDGFQSGWNEISGTLTYSSADSPTFVATTSIDMSGTIGVGNRIKLTQTTAKYFIVTAIDTTTITLYGGTDYTLANAAITLPYFSIQKAPFGFPLNPTKWTVEWNDSGQRSQGSATQNAWYNLNSALINVPIGMWRVYYQCLIQANHGSAAADIRSSLSTSATSVSDNDFLSANTNTGATVATHAFREKTLSVTVKTPYYLITSCPAAITITLYNRGDDCPTIIRAVCAYL